jgi:hypothetical protein
MNFAEEIKGWLGIKLHGINLIVDIVNGCPLSCPSCAVGSIGKRPIHYMSIETFRRILDKAGKVRNLQLYAYSDSCMHTHLDWFIQECTDRGIQTSISTVLQTTKCNFADVVEARPSEFRISFAGWDYMDYYQKPAKWEIFNRKLEEVCALPRYPETKWTMAFHLYNDNLHELRHVRRTAKELNLHLVVIPAIFMPCEKVVEKDYTDDDLLLIDHLIETPEETIADLKFHKDYCLLWKQLYMDAKADVYLCQLVYKEQFKLGNFFDMSNKEILRKIKTHPFCWKCMQKGGHAYQYCFANFIKYEDPVGFANKQRRKSHSVH